VSRDKPTNLVASVLARLRNNSQSAAVPFQQVLQQYAIERFLYRVSELFEALTTKFADEHRIQWNAFVRKAGEK
jgi:hypothetical protein